MLPVGNGRVRAACGELAERYGVVLARVEADCPIPGSYWGAPEAGLIRDRLYARDDTPVHSLLHELSHYVCMSPARRGALDTDAGGSVIEECAVCYLQLLLADRIPAFGFSRGLRDMDGWGYSFREGSAAAWFEGDGSDALDWLMAHELVSRGGRVTWRLRAA